MTASLSSSRSIAWTVWIIATVFYAYQYILRVMPNIMLDDIMQQFGIGAATYGQFSGVYYIGYSALHLPVGILLDRCGPRKIMTACILLTVVGLMPLLCTTYWVYPIVGRFVVGLGSSAAILGLFKIIRITFSEQRFSRMLSISGSIGVLGAIYGGGPVNYMREALGYQAVVQLFVAAGILLAGATYWIVRDVKQPTSGTVLADIKEVFGNKKVLWFCVCSGLMVGPLEGFSDVWGTSFLKQVYGFDGALAASLPSLIFIGLCFGGPLLSLIAERVGSHLATIIGTGVVMATLFFLILTCQLSSGGISVCFALVGVCSAFQPLALYKASTYVRERVAGLATAVANMIIMIFGYAFHATIGGVVTIMDGASSSEALVYGVSVIPAALCLGVCGFIILFTKEKKAITILKTS